ncbi:hypothetical protein JRI60_09175 [Archangium violaceum]|uniref:hypothetical protein n=1 Tax=Archangium violaceum TaxID=83451 RepID=UPI0019525678|nr:hypothetical protein [Archangium violaceum]QRN99169.1 hypothetical protein JRI60_09175 [Archangium violaceum]
MSVSTQRKSKPGLMQTLRALARAEREVIRQKKALARMSRSASTPTVFDPQHARAMHTLTQCSGLLCDTSVRGIGLGTKMTKGRETGELAAVVFVPRKRSLSELRKRKIQPLPREVKCGGRTLPVDVQEMGRVRWQARVGDSLGPFGEFATLGAFGTYAGRTVAITAMHATHLFEFPDGSVGPTFFCPSNVGNANARNLGSLVRGSRNGIDAALIQLEDPSTMVPMPGIRGSRPLRFREDEGTVVRMLGAMTPHALGTIEHIHLDIHPNNLAACFTISLPSAKGDSGAALVDGDGFIVGFLVGRITVNNADFALAQPSELVLNTLGCTIP